MFITNANEIWRLYVTVLKMSMALVVKNPPANAGDTREFSSWSCYVSSVGQLHFFSTCLQSRIPYERMSLLSNTVGLMDKEENEHSEL